jgi:hypothetical protein
MPRSAQYVAYCLSNGVFRVQLFPQPDLATASNALSQVLASSAWKRLNWNDPSLTLDQRDEGYAKTILWMQVTNISNKGAAPTGRPQ